jgi:hypothetical protein
MCRLAQKLVHEQSLLVFGRGYNYATALEAALKVKEVALMHRRALWDGEERGEMNTGRRQGALVHGRGALLLPCVGRGRTGAGARAAGCPRGAVRRNSGSVPPASLIPPFPTRSEGILAGEMKHGPLALIDDTMPTIVVATQDSMHCKMLRWVGGHSRHSTAQQMLEGVCPEGANLKLVALDTPSLQLKLRCRRRRRRAPRGRAPPPPRGLPAALSTRPPPPPRLALAV